MGGADKWLLLYMGAFANAMGAPLFCSFRLKARVNFES